MKFKYLFFSLFFTLTSCNYFNGKYENINVFSSLDSFNIENKRIDSEKYTLTKSGTNILTPPLLDYSLSLNNQKHHISLSKSYYPNDTYRSSDYIATFDNQIICNKYFDWFDNSNVIVDSNNNYVFFDRNKLTVLNNEYQIIYYHYFENLDKTYVSNAAYEIDNQLVLIYLGYHKTILFYLDDDYSLTKQLTFKNEDEIYSLMVRSFRLNFENEISAYLDKETLLLHGHLIKLDYENFTSKVETDYNVISTPKLVDNTYIYKAIKLGDDELIYDPYHSFNTTSDSIQTISDSNAHWVDYVFARIKKDESVDFFFVIPDSIAYSISYLKLSTTDTFTHQFFDAPVIFTGYAYHEDDYYYEIANTNVRVFCKDECESFTHFPI